MARMIYEPERRRGREWPGTGTCPAGHEYPATRQNTITSEHTGIGHRPRNTATVDYNPHRCPECNLRTLHWRSDP